MSSKRFWIAGVTIPLVGLVLLVARAELRLATGEVFRVAIAGFDPRDLLHGQYLQYRYDFDWRGAHSCGPVSDGKPTRLLPSCCICLTRGATPQDAPGARVVACEAASRCDAYLRTPGIEPPQRYFVPEASAPALERALAKHRGSVDLTVRANGEAAVGELYLDGRPWREVVPR